MRFPSSRCEKERKEGEKGEKWDVYLEQRGRIYMFTFLMQAYIFKNTVYSPFAVMAHKVRS